MVRAKTGMLLCLMGVLCFGSGALAQTQGQAEAAKATADLDRSSAIVAQTAAINQIEDAEEERDGSVSSGRPSLDSLRQEAINAMFADGMTTAQVATYIAIPDGYKATADQYMSDANDSLTFGHTGVTGGDSHLYDYGWWAFLGYWNYAYNAAVDATADFQEALINYNDADSAANYAYWSYQVARETYEDYIES